MQKRIEPSLPIIPGAAVMLNSGGPNMLVKDVVGSICSCIWIYDKTVIAGDFNIVCLTMLGDVNVMTRQSSHE